MCLDVTCHLYFWQSDWDLLRTTAVIRAWNGYWNKSAQLADPGENNSPAAHTGTRTREFAVWYGAHIAHVCVKNMNDVLSGKNWQQPLLVSVTLTVYPLPRAGFTVQRISQPLQ